MSGKAFKRVLQGEKVRDAEGELCSFLGSSGIFDEPTILVDNVIVEDEIILSNIGFSNEYYQYPIDI